MVTLGGIFVGFFWMGQIWGEDCFFLPLYHCGRHFYASFGFEEKVIKMYYIRSLEGMRQ